MAAASTRASAVPDSAEFVLAFEQRVPDGPAAPTCIPTTSVRQAPAACLKIGDPLNPPNA